MRKITMEIVNAFQNSRSLKIGNSRTDGESMWLFDNKIAEIRRDGLWITNAGWNSSTTKERLNGLSSVNIIQRRGKWYLNEVEWNGDWVHVDSFSRGVEVSTRGENVQEVEFDVTSEWMEQGYSKPVYSVFHTLVEDDLERWRMYWKTTESLTAGWSQTLKGCISRIILLWYSLANIKTQVS